MPVRPLSAVPTLAKLLLALGLCAQLVWHFSHPSPVPSAQNLPQPVSLHTLQLASLGEPIGLSKVLLLYLQSFDDQPGVKKAFRALDYARVEDWLEVSLQLDPLSNYPLFLASRVYGVTSDAAKQKEMFDFVYRHFYYYPNLRWDSLAFAALMTKHRRHDLQQAHKYAGAIRQYATGADVPTWAKQMDIFILEDLHEYRAASDLLNTLLQSGQIKDAKEAQFLQERLQQIQAKLTP